MCGWTCNHACVSVLLREDRREVDTHARAIACTHTNTYTNKTRRGKGRRISKDRMGYCMRAFGGWEGRSIGQEGKGDDYLQKANRDGGKEIYAR